MSSHRVSNGGSNDASPAPPPPQQQHTVTTATAIATMIGGHFTLPTPIAPHQVHLAESEKDEEEVHSWLSVSSTTYPYVTEDSDTSVQTGLFAAARPMHNRTNTNSSSSTHHIMRYSPMDTHAMLMPQCVPAAAFDPTAREDASSRNAGLTTTTTPTAATVSVRRTANATSLGGRPYSLAPGLLKLYANLSINTSDALKAMTPRHGDHADVFDESALTQALTNSYSVSREVNASAATSTAICQHRTPCCPSSFSPTNALGGGDGAAPRSPKHQAFQRLERAVQARPLFQLTPETEAAEACRESALRFAAERMAQLNF